MTESRDRAVTFSEKGPCSRRDVPKRAVQGWRPELRSAFFLRTTNPLPGGGANALRHQPTSGGTVNIRKSSKAPLALVLPLTAGIGLSACSSGDSDSSGTSAAAATSSTVDNPEPVAVVRAIPGGET